MTVTGTQPGSDSESDCQWQMIIGTIRKNTVSFNIIEVQPVTVTVTVTRLGNLNFNIMIGTRARRRVPICQTRTVTAWQWLCGRRRPGRPPPRASESVQFKFAGGDRGGHWLPGPSP